MGDALTIGRPTGRLGVQMDPTMPIADARAVVDAFAAAGNPGVIGMDGQMYDRPHLRRAERILARAKAAGVA